jgi:hypothetical protein
MLTLYKTSRATDESLVWSIWQDGRQVYTEWFPPGATESQVSTADYPSVIMATRGMNAAITKKKRNGYSTMADDVANRPLLPMLANTFSKRSVKSLTFPYIGQPKYDGNRGLFSPASSILYSRTARPIVAYPRLVLQLCDLSSRLPAFEKRYRVVLDGEIYKHKTSLQTINGNTARTVNIDEDEETQFVVYDCFVPELPKLDQATRLQYLIDQRSVFENVTTRVELSTHEIVTSVADVHTLHQRYVDDGYEGVMLRSFDGIYRQGTRSSYLLKHKVEKDATYTVRSATLDKKGNPLFTLDSPMGVFKAVYQATDAQRKALIPRIPELKGTPANIRFFCYTDSGTPRNARIVSFESLN